MRISDWSSDVCSSDLDAAHQREWHAGEDDRSIADRSQCAIKQQQDQDEAGRNDQLQPLARRLQVFELAAPFEIGAGRQPNLAGDRCLRIRNHRSDVAATHVGLRSEEHTSELQSLMRISYAVFCLKKKKNTTIMQMNSQ